MKVQPFMEPDALLRLSICRGEARVFLLRTTAMAQYAGNVNQASDVAIAAMGRLMTGTAILGAMMKEDGASVTCRVDGGGPGGRMTCVYRGGNVKVTMERPQTALPARDGRPDVAGLIGREGTLSVVRDFGAGEPYIGQCALVSGELGEDFAQYFYTSEQKSSVVALGCIVKDGLCLSSGGAFVQPMPGCSQDTLSKLDLRAMLFSGVSRDLFEDTLDDLAARWLRDLEPVTLSREPLTCRCDCSRARMERALKSIGKKELAAMINEDHGASIVCHFCRREYAFDEDALIALLTENAN